MFDEVSDEKFWLNPMKLKLLNIVLSNLNGLFQELNQSQVYVIGLKMLITIYCASRMG